MKDGETAIVPIVKRGRSNKQEQWDPHAEGSGTCKNCVVGGNERYSKAVALSDTSQKAGEIYFRRLNGMTPSERLGLGAALWEAGDSLQRSAIRRKHPHADEAEITFRTLGQGLIGSDSKY